MIILKGKTIFIGKEPSNGRLCVSLSVNGQHKSAVIGEMHSVPNSVSRCKPGENAAHCKITVDNDGNMVVTNMKSQNVTYVNGTEIVSKKINSNSHIELGKDHYVINLSTVLRAASKIVGVTATTSRMLHSAVPVTTGQEYSIRHLKRVWEEYNCNMKEIKIRQRNYGLLSSIPMAFSMLGGLIAGIAPDIRNFALVFTGIALFIMLIGFYKRFTDKSIDEAEELTEDFQRNYVCPNPKCHHFMGNQPYNILRQNKSCPYCKCNLTDE